MHYVRRLEMAHNKWSSTGGGSESKSYGKSDGSSHTLHRNSGQTSEAPHHHVTNQPSGGQERHFTGSDGSHAAIKPAIHSGGQSYYYGNPTGGGKPTGKAGGKK
jgi:hypothetical protein